MTPKKVKLSQELIDKAGWVFAGAAYGITMAGRGLSRRELRALERGGIVEKQLWPYGSRGNRYVWRLIPTLKIAEVSEGESECRR